VAVSGDAAADGEAERATVRASGAKARLFSAALTARLKVVPCYKSGFSAAEGRALIRKSVAESRSSSRRRSAAFFEGVGVEKPGAFADGDDLIGIDIVQVIRPVPLGQRTSMASALVEEPRPKVRTSSLEER